VPIVYQILNIIEVNLLHISSIKDLVVVANVRHSQIFFDEKPCWWNTNLPRPWDPLQLLCIDSLSLLFGRQWLSDGEKNKHTILVKKKVKIYFKSGVTIINTLKLTKRFKSCLHLFHYKFNS
jgi:hypothetical protein